MKRRIGVIVVIAAALVGGASAAVAGPTTNTTASHWGCVGSQTLNQVICFSNPLPSRLPVPSTPTPS